MTGPTLNRERRELLAAVGRGNVFRHSGGHIMRHRRTGMAQRVDRSIRAFGEAGWVELADDGMYALTRAGRAALEEAS